jgi:hypothetical protein
VIVSTGEQVTIALLAMALIKRGVPAVSYTGNQVRILTDSAHNKARILQIDDQKIRRPEGRSRGGCRRFPGRRRARQHHHPRSWRFRHHGRGTGGCPEG